MKFLIGGFFLVKILIHLLNPEYGYFSDEMYYIAIADGFSRDAAPHATPILNVFGRTHLPRGDLIQVLDGFRFPVSCFLFK